MMQRTKHKGTDVVTATANGAITYAMIRDHVDGFTGFSPRGRTMQIGKVWSMAGPTVREAMIDQQVIKFMIYGGQNAVFNVEDIREIRRAMFEECEAQGCWVHDSEPFITPREEA